MKNFDSRTYSIHDFLEWESNGQLELSPRFQRKSVWNEKAKSYLMDTIVNGKPMPKVFIRQKTNAQTRKSVREVVDGQQRLRTILSFIKDAFPISKQHNKKFGGKYYSQLSEVDENIQAQILSYEISVDLLVNMSDADVLDVFGRLNSYSVLLNTQEKIHANHFGPFKTLADRLAHENNDFWIDNKILTPQKILRMSDVELVSDILVALNDGIKSKKQIEKYYELYETDELPVDVEVLEVQFGQIVSLIRQLYPEGLKDKEFRRIHVIYSLFVSLYHIQFGVPNLKAVGQRIEDGDIAKITNRLDRIELIFMEENKAELTEREIQFLNDCRRATTDTAVRIRRSEYLNDVILGEV
ncbi:hypothetical protein COO59_02715 [Mixta theicola]|uniref:GmrSD restriction endonucleases N-terminal domain-containing protein n=1 Tax=Mixta theicola TaxID=1458355 RepID=A0A2K1QCV1_9GAMM|nr:DUF262 domain-containing protein [Mixta theicola]PNS12850.1 hypothetical protein COO59_02715 [Mixta theicola]GLR09099.1 hypothetical protein GCM10007905_18190 [Mixta theicola]